MTSGSSSGRQLSSRTAAGGGSAPLSANSRVPSVVLPPTPQQALSPKGKRPALSEEDSSEIGGEEEKKKNKKRKRTGFACCEFCPSCVVRNISCSYWESGRGFLTSFVSFAVEQWHVGSVGPRCVHHLPFAFEGREGGQEEPCAGTPPRTSSPAG